MTASSDSERESTLQSWVALKAACSKSHKSGPGAAAMCICGQGGGGSPACNALGRLRNLILYTPIENLPPDVAKEFELWRSVI